MDVATSPFRFAYGSDGRVSHRRRIDFPRRRAALLSLPSIVGRTRFSRCSVRLPCRRTDNILHNWYRCLDTARSHRQKKLKGKIKITKWFLCCAFERSSWIIYVFCIRWKSKVRDLRRGCGDLNACRVLFVFLVSGLKGVVVLWG